MHSLISRFWGQNIRNGRTVLDLPLDLSNASKYRRPPAKVYASFETIIGLSYLSCHNVLYYLPNTSLVSNVHCTVALLYSNSLNTQRLFNLPLSVWDRDGSHLHSNLAPGSSTSCVGQINYTTNP